MRRYVLFDLLEAFVLDHELDQRFIVRFRPLQLKHAVVVATVAYDVTETSIGTHYNMRAVHSGCDCVSTNNALNTW